MTVKLKESTGVLGAVAGKKRWRARLIATGPGSSGFYTEAALKDTGPAAFPVGTKINADHQTWEEMLAQPAGSIKSLIGVIATEPEYLTPEDDLAGLYAEVEFIDAWAPFVEQVGQFVGLSINAQAYGDEINDAGLRVIEGFVPHVLNTVDLVTAPGARGKLFEAVESYREKSDTITAIEALSNDRREELNNLVKDAYQTEDSYIWVRDFDDSNGSVYFDVSGPDEYGTFSQNYTLDENDVAVSLTGERTEVRSQTKYVPLNTTSTSSTEAANKEMSMTPEEQTAFATAVAEAVAKALAVEEKTEPVEQEPTGPDLGEVTEAIASSGLPAAARAKVIAAVKGGADVTEAIKVEQDYINEVKESAAAEPTVGTVREAATASTGNFTVGGW